MMDYSGLPRPDAAEHEDEQRSCELIAGLVIVLIVLMLVGIWLLGRWSAHAEAAARAEHSILECRGREAA